MCMEVFSGFLAFVMDGSDMQYAGVTQLYMSSLMRRWKRQGRDRRRPVRKVGG